MQTKRLSAIGTVRVSRKGQIGLGRGGMRLEIRGKLFRIFQFFMAQGVTLAGNLACGLFCIRLLPVSDYAKFVVVFAVQGTLVILMDVNFSGTLIPLVGERVDDLKFIADYVASLRRLSGWTYALIGTGLVFVFPILVKNRGWSWRIVSAMVVTLLISTWFIRISSAYGTVMILRRDRNTWYKGQLIQSLGTLALLGVFWAGNALSAFSAILINVAGYVFLGTFYYLRARKLLGIQGEASGPKRKAIINLALPNMPQAVFYALQGQISLYLITYFGRTGGVASIGALSRLGQIFAIFGQLNPIFIEPYFGRLPAMRLKRSYMLALLIAGAGCLGAGGAAAAFPQLFLWILGPKYSSLRYEVVLAICTSAISTFSGVLWSIHCARRFVYWWTNISGIVLIFLLQALFFFKGDLGSVRSVLYLNLATNLASLLINCLAGMYGFVFGARAVDREEPIPPENPGAGSGFSKLNMEQAP